MNGHGAMRVEGGSNMQAQRVGVCGGQRDGVLDDKLMSMIRDTNIHAILLEIREVEGELGILYDEGTGGVAMERT